MQKGGSISIQAIGATWPSNLLQMTQGRSQTFKNEGDKGAQAPKLCPEMTQKLYIWMYSFETSVFSQIQNCV